MNLSAVILTKNEEDNIKDCIKSVKFADEIVVIDDYSKDKTVEIAKKLGAKVYKRELGNDFSAQRNYSLEKAKGRWVLFLDADERVTKSLKNEIIQKIGNPLLNCVGYYTKRKDFLWGKELKRGEVGRIKFLRLARRGAGRWKRSTHEVWEIRGRVNNLKNSILHYPHQTVKEFLTNINRFSTLHAQANKAEGKKANLVRVVIWPAGHFFVNFVLRLGFLDKTRGFVLAIMMSFHSFLAWGKLWLIQRQRPD